MYRNYIFDLYGTLVDIRTDEYSLDFWRKAVSVFASNGASFTPSELRNTYRRLVRRERRLEQLRHPLYRYIDIDLLRVFRVLYRGKGIEADEALLLDTAHRFRTASTEHIRLYDGVRELLDTLKARGKHIYLLSNAQESFTVPELLQLGIYEDFDGIMISSQERVCKPQRQFFDRLCERYALDKTESVMIGNDQYSDIAGAAAAGIDSLYIYQDISPEVEDEDAIQAGWKIMDKDVRKISQYLLKNDGGTTCKAEI